MKLFFSFLLVVAMMHSYAQRSFNVMESSEMIADGQHPVFIVNVYEASTDVIEKEWKSLMKDYKAKVSTGDEIFADNALIETMSANTVDVYALLEPSVNGAVKLIVAVDLGGGFVSSSQYSSQASVIKGMMTSFAKRISQEAIAKQLEEATKELKKLNNEKQDLIKENENLHKKIKEYEDGIVQAKEDIKTNESDQATKSTQITEQEGVVQKIQAKVDELK